MNAYRNLSIKLTAQAISNAGAKPCHCTRSSLATQSERLVKQCLKLGIEPIYNHK